MSRLIIIRQEMPGACPCKCRLSSFEPVEYKAVSRLTSFRFFPSWLLCLHRVFRDLFGHEEQKKQQRLHCYAGATNMFTNGYKNRRCNFKMAEPVTFFPFTG